MDTLSLAVVPPSNTTSTTFAVQQYSSSPVVDSGSSLSAGHSDGVWVAPPEQPARQQVQTTPSFSHSQPQRTSTASFVGPPQSHLNGKIEVSGSIYFVDLCNFHIDEQLHDYSHQSSQSTYSSNRTDDQQQSMLNRAQTTSTFSSRQQTHTSYSPS